MACEGADDLVHHKRGHVGVAPVAVMSFESREVLRRMLELTLLQLVVHPPAAVERPDDRTSGGGGGGDGGRSSSSILRDIAAAALTASIAGPISQAPSVIAAHQQAHAVSFGVAFQHILSKSGPRGFYGGLLLRTTSLAGSMFVFPFSIETAQPLYERWRRKRTDLERPSRG